MKRSILTVCALTTLLTSPLTAFAGVAPIEAGSLFFLLGRSGETDPFAAQISANVTGADAITLIAPDGSPIPLDMIDTDNGDLFAETNAPTVSDLLDGTGSPGESTWQVLVEFPGSVVSTYTFQALFESSLTETDFPQRATITNPTPGPTSIAPTSIDWTEPPDAALADAVIVSLNSDAVGDFFEQSTLEGTLTLNPGSANESVAIPAATDPGEYQLDIEYARIGDPTAVGLSTLTRVSGPIIDWGLPAVVASLPYPDDTPFYAITANTEVRYTLIDVDGDFNDDSLVNATDADILYQNIGLTFSPELDLSLNGIVDGDDFNLWLDHFGTLPGDFNYDRRVDLIDLSTLATNFGLPAFNAFQGDANADGIVDLIDLSILATNFGFDGTSVPEPAAATLGLMSLVLMRRR
ncbi:MAG: hypothetical protein RIG82_01990 [Phycisphaeraceae bacterium]